MAEAPQAAAGTTPPNHLGTSVPTGDLDEKKDYGAADPPKQAPSDEEEDDEDMDALIEELESQDQNVDDEEEEETQAGAARIVPEELLQTSSTSTVHPHLVFQLLTKSSSRRSVQPRSSRPKKEVRYESDEGREGESHSQVLGLLHRSHSVRHGGKPTIRVLFLRFDFPLSRNIGTTLLALSRRNVFEVFA
jgi:hypothetical protein